ncbi:unnamed protein product [Arabidopsis halleri]
MHKAWYVVVCGGFARRLVDVNKLFLKLRPVRLRWPP